jgi:hypothetical protein
VSQSDRNPAQLENWHRLAIYGVTVILVASGLAWLGLHYFGRGSGEFGDAMHPMEPLMIKIHGAAAMIALLLYGSLLTDHAVKAWRMRRNLGLGSMMVTVLMILVVTGWLLYYGSDEATRPTVSAIHWVIGLIIAAVMPLHIWNGRRLRSQAKVI